MLPHAVAHDINGELKVLTLGYKLSHVVAYGINGENITAWCCGLCVTTGACMLPHVLAHDINREYGSA